LTDHITIQLEQSGIWRSTDISRHRSRPKGEPGIVTRPVRLKTCRGDALARVTAFPLRSATVGSISCLDVLEFVRNDIGLIDEIARVLVRGGKLSLRVPATGPFAGFDHLNLMHYVVDITRRGARPRETYEVGWRRHYGVSDIEEMLGTHRFRLVATRHRRLALAEVAGFASIILFRWLWPSPQRFRAAQRIVRKVERFEHRIRLPFGSILEVEAIRLDE